MSVWTPREIIIHEAVKNDPGTRYFVKKCPEARIEYVPDSRPQSVVAASTILSLADGMLTEILAGKSVIHISSSVDVIGGFKIDDTRMKCPEFQKLTLASNGCFYQCEWCFLKGTYRTEFPFISVRLQYDKIKDAIRKKLNGAPKPIIFNTGELADSLSLEHLTRAGRELIPWFGKRENGYMFMLTKSDNVDLILDLPHKGHTILAWSLNAPEVSREFRIGAPSFEKRLEAARKAQEAGYRIRFRIDPVLPVPEWERKYREMIRRMFEKVTPERITIGTLRFQQNMYNSREHFFPKGSGIWEFVKQMEPMFPPKVFVEGCRPKSGKYSFLEEERVRIFKFVKREIRKHSDCPIALCKESANVWDKVGLKVSRCRCVCQLDRVDMSEN